MLVLTRKVGDTIAIGDDIKIIVMAVKGNKFVLELMRISPLLFIEKKSIKRSMLKPKEHQKRKQSS